jgi:Holliday junction resolvasome RuvABC endonuclease subunit
MAPVSAVVTMRILALDFATKTGWAAEGLSGVQVFETKRGESPGMRFLRFRGWLRDMCNELVHPEVIAYEQPHHRGGAATEVAYGFLTEVKTMAADKGIELMPVHSSTLKKWATGKGNAGKGEMVFEAKRRGYNPQDDNEADACLIYDYAMEELGK